MTLLTLALPCVFAAGCGAPPHVGLALEAFFCSFCAIRPFMSAAEDVAVVLEQKELRVGTSRFLSQPAFVAYKAVLGAYFLFWAVYWPEIDGFSKQAMHQLTFWTWDACAGYFAVSTATAILCWRATKNRHGPAPVSPSSPLGGATSASLVHVEWSDSGDDARGAPLHGSSGTLSSTPRGTAPAEGKQATAAARAATATVTTAGAAAEGREGVPGRGRLRPVSWMLRWLQLVLWNIACVASLLVTLVWASEDYREQVQDGVKNFDVQAHGLIAFFMLVDQVAVADEFRLKHVIISQVYGLVYLAFSVCWFYTAPEEDKYLYEGFLDWERNRVNACILGATAVGVLAPLAASVHFFICRMREALHRRNQRIRTRSRLWRIYTQGSMHC